MTTLVTDREASGTTVVGYGAYTYEPVENWAKLPPGWSFKEKAASVWIGRITSTFSIAASTR